MLRSPGYRRAARAAVAATLVTLTSLAPAVAADANPTAVVAMGDSEISGEGAGSYESGTNGPTNYCHRSLKAWIMVVPIAADAHINLACSGGDSANLTIGGPGQYGEASQADQLASVARKYRVKYVFVTVGANDDPQFGSTASDCVYAYVFQTGVGCAVTDGADWQQRVDRMVPKVENALTDIKTVMSRYTYPYQIVVVSYASPAPAAPRYADWQYWSKVYAGCPLYNSDAQWGHDVATPQLDGGERTAASAKSLRFVYMADGFKGHELCAQGITSSQEWVRGLTYDPSSSTWWSSHAVQQSLHPNALGHAQIANCIGEFVNQTSYTEAECAPGSDGNAHAVAYP
jgi:lysophospholipase L1-like esterase